MNCVNSLCRGAILWNVRIWMSSLVKLTQPASAKFPCMISDFIGCRTRREWYDGNTRFSESDFAELFFFYKIWSYLIDIEFCIAKEKEMR